MEEFTVNEWFPGISNFVILGIAGGIAVLFIALLIFDSRRRARQRASSRNDNRSRPGIFKRMALARQALKEEMARRDARSERGRHRKK